MTRLLRKEQADDTQAIKPKILANTNIGRTDRPTSLFFLMVIS